MAMRAGMGCAANAAQEAGHATAVVLAELGLRNVLDDPMMKL